MSRPADLSVIVCSLNGATGVDRVLRALRAQTIADRLQVVVVDDGSTDNTSEVASRHVVTLVRHLVNRGLAAARNSGIAAATAPIVAFLDDDCEPEPAWAETLLLGYDDPEVLGVGGLIEVAGPDSFNVRYLRRHNPLEPLEVELMSSSGLLFRLGLYLKRQWAPPVLPCASEVYALVGANMSFRRESLEAIGGFDERFSFGAEELEACLRLRDAFPDRRFTVIPGADVRHHYEPGLRDSLRRSRAYGRGSARLHHVRPTVPLTVFPTPFAALALLVLAASGRRWALPAALALPLVVFPSGLRRVIATRSGEALLDGWVQLAQETYGNVGLLEGVVKFRGLEARVLPVALDQLQPAVAGGERP